MISLPRRLFVYLLFILSAFFQTDVRGQSQPDALDRAAEAIDAEGLMQHIRILSSDEFEGRLPGTSGEEKTVAYMVDAFKRLGLKPGNPDGTYIQKVPLVGIQSSPEIELVSAGKPVSMSFPADYVAVSPLTQPEVKIEQSDIIFVGYGIVAPEYGWDDYKGVDVRGKTILMLVNDPQIPDPNDPTRLDSTMFKGRAMTYYGRWTYKFEIAAEKGAAAAIIIHETGPAGYPYAVIRGSRSRENFDIELPDGVQKSVLVEGWITDVKARELLAAAGQDFETLKSAATRPDFKPVILDATVSFSIKNKVRKVQSQNVVARLEGADPVRKDEYVIFTAHWDHLGKDTTLHGDTIYNGALDNASGTAALLELANAFARLSSPPDRSILFLAVTAEEQGLLGAQFYASAPLYPFDRTLANINMDALNPWGRTRDMVVVGYGNTTIEDLLREEAIKQGRIIVPESAPENGGFYRSDHFAFVKMGVPALYAKAGEDYVDRDEAFSRQKRDEYTANDYHKPSDEIKPDWDPSGMIEDTRLYFQVAYRIASEDPWPEWKPGTEFKTRREESLNQAGSR